MATIAIEGIALRGYHGVYPEEHETGGLFVIDIYITAAIARPAVSDSLRDAIDYAAIYEIVVQRMANPAHLLEHLVEEMGQEILRYSPDIEGVKVRISKQNPLYMPYCAQTFVEEFFSKIEEKTR